MSVQTRASLRKSRVCDITLLGVNISLVSLLKARVRVRVRYPVRVGVGVRVVGLGVAAYVSNATFEVGHNNFDSRYVQLLTLLIRIRQH